MAVVSTLVLRSSRLATVVLLSVSTAGRPEPEPCRCGLTEPPAVGVLRLAASRHDHGSVVLAGARFRRAALTTGLVGELRRHRGRGHLLRRSIGCAAGRAQRRGTPATWPPPTLLVAGLVIVVLALSALVREWRRMQHLEPGARDTDAALRVPDAEAGLVHDGHGAHSSPWAGWLLLVPALTIMLIAPPALGSDAVGTGAPRTPPTAGATDYAPLPPGEAPALDLVDLVSRVAADPDGPATTRDVTLVGSGTGTQADGFVPALHVVSAEPVAPPTPVYES